MTPVVYLDHHSTTPCDERVLEAMQPYFSGIFGNPAAITHPHGREAAMAVEESRAGVARFFGCAREEVVFTSGATESNNLLFSGLRVGAGDHIVISAVEHKSVLAPATRLRDRGVEVEILPCDSEGFIAPDAVESALRPSTRLVSIIAANGEVGTLQPVDEIATLCRQRKVFFHTDATQAVGKVAVDWSSCDAISLSAHKFYGPKGSGALVVRGGLRLSPLIAGGGQERGIRSGTLNVPGIVGLARALELREAEMAGEAARLAALRNRLWDDVIARIPRAFVNGPRGLRLPGNLSITLPGVEADAVIMALRRFSLSAGSACSSGDRAPSHVLVAIGLSESDAYATIRIGLGRDNRDDEVTAFVEDLRTAVANLREISGQ